MKRLTVSDVQKEDCTGCGACRNLCPVEAIRMEPDGEGFLYPRVNADLCVRCEKCYRSCPVNNKVPRGDVPQEFYAVCAETDLRLKSSSGGVFSVLASAVLDAGGCVAGASWTEDWKVRHVVVESEEGMDSLRLSKYVQSDTNTVYSEIKRALASGRPVLFGGCPCQVAGLRSYLGKEEPNLLTADIVCHGVPSPKAFEKYLAEVSHGEKVTYVNFREKDHGWGTPVTVKTDGGRVYHNDCFKDSWYIAFLQGLSTRPACGHCPYASVERVGDITIGDFWGVGDLDPSCNDDKGTGLTILNTAAGKKFFERIRKRFPLVKKFEKDAVTELAKRRNGQLIAPRPTHPGHERFFRNVDELSFSKSVADAMDSHYDVGVVGWWYNANYGGTLTYYALHQTLRQLGFSVLMIESCTPESPDNIPRRFAKKYYAISPSYPQNRMGVLNAKCTSFVSGSDQLFNPWLWQYSGPQYYLDFSDPHKKIVSYASSFGEDGYPGPDEYRMQTSYYLHRFSALSVREDYAVNTMRKWYGLDAEKVLDPIFLCGRGEFEKLADRSSLTFDRKYCLSFFLDPDEGKRSAILSLSKTLGLPYNNLLHATDFENNFKRLHLDNTFYNVDVEDFLNYYRNAEFVITDSFHGTCLSVIFRKPFIAVANKQRGVSRFVSVLKDAGLSDRLVYDVSEIGQRQELLKPIDYEAVEAKMRPEIEASREWLKRALTEPYSNPADPFHVMDTANYKNFLRILRLQETVFKQQQQIDELKKKLGE